MKCSQAEEIPPKTEGLAGLFMSCSTSSIFKHIHASEHFGQFLNNVALIKTNYIHMYCEVFDTRMWKGTIKQLGRGDSNLKCFNWINWGGGDFNCHCFNSIISVIMSILIITEKYIYDI